MQETMQDLQGFFNQPEFFLGVFENDHYKVTRKYIESSGTLQRLYYTRMDSLHTKPKAQLVLIHGFGEHSSRFLDFGENFVQNGYLVHLIDLRGFGYSGGARGVSMIEDMIKDIDTCLRQAEEDLPLFIFGHSMGGLLVNSLGCRNPDLKIAGFISSSALLGDPTDRKIEQFKKDGVSAIGDFLGDVLVNSMINVASLTKNNNNIARIINDFHNVPFFGMKMAKSMLENIGQILPSAKYFQYPLLIYHGQRDGITNYKDSIRFFNKVQSKDKFIQLFNTGYHEMHHDSEVNDIEKMVLEWMDKRVPNAPKFSKDYTLNTKPPNIVTKRQKWTRILLSIMILLYFLFILRNWNRVPNTKISVLKKLALPLYFLIRKKFIPSK